MTVRRTKAEWAEIIDAFKKSGQTQTAFCREHGLSAKTLGFHVRSGMEQGKAKKPIQRSEETWTALISQQRASGMNRHAWCIKHGVSPDSMTSAEKRLMARPQDASDSGWMEFNLAKVRVPPPRNENANWGIRIRKEDLDIEVSTDYPVENLATLIERLVKQC